MSVSLRELFFFDIHSGVPYSRAALSEIVGLNNQQSCSISSAELLAIEAFRNCASIVLEESRTFIALSDSNVFGVSCTAALVSSIPKKGSHRCHVSTVNSSNCSTWSIEFSKGSRSREGEDYVCSRMILDAILWSSSLPNLPLDYLIQTDQVGVECIVHQQTPRVDRLLGQLRNSEIGMLLFVSKTLGLNENPSTLNELFHIFDDIVLPTSTLVYPGSFNPFHEGHAKLTKAALSMLQSRVSTVTDDNPLVVFEIAVVNADKPSLSLDEITSRVLEFSGGGNAANLLKDFGITNYAVCVTSQPLFASKADLFPGCHFLLGADTLVRLFDEKYYRHSRENMLTSIVKLIDRCPLIVGGRVNCSGDFVSTESVLAPLNLPDMISDRICSIPETSFRSDISSSAIRANREKQSN